MYFISLNYIVFTHLKQNFLSFLAVFSMFTENVLTVKIKFCINTS